MIILEHDQQFHLVKQHDHAQASGQIARQMNIPRLTFDSRTDDVYIAVDEHDRGWIDLDETPIWNDKTQTPFSFEDYPLYPKLQFYRLGLDEVEVQSPYAALLCSLHYASFFEDVQDSKALAFYEQERTRQRRLLQQLALWEEDDHEAIDTFYDLLQFCDHLSLFICLSTVDKEEENFRWQDNGFRQRFEHLDFEHIMPRWVDESTIALTPFPLHEPTRVTVKEKILTASEIEQHGLADAYHAASYREREVLLTSG
ncbi:DUF3891 family protein [Caldalkalibacillus salinus]|uniref:DUF3891 family protein n=1 Tax=Caldalkalibacillus salinus TaxID=2803787 RepID=UPI0019212242